jgi:hypothetical protein
LLALLVIRGSVTKEPIHVWSNFLYVLSALSYYKEILEAITYKEKAFVWLMVLEVPVQDWAALVIAMRLWQGQHIIRGANDGANCSHPKPGSRERKREKTLVP